ncbi:peptidase M23 [Sphingobium sp. Leaf26]|uniref:M23 family metallopeptidase n=1 Tax=Sphingobium sp. Leaf26 TaxID=1735693 RepID=UPI0006FF512B|nr:M23 family metallopeptidase [Sphingobium sp. Leaf26]KQN00732.1 peptidase M23 [Sphingobium sp. Leaf26]
MNGRGSAKMWGGGAVALLLCAGFAHFCVRIVPADAPSPAVAIRLPDAHHRADNGPLLIPVEGVPAAALTDTFTQARADGARPHDAIDIMAARGRAVLAAANGPVEKLFWSEDGGRTLYQRSPDGHFLYYYAHLDGYAPGLREGQWLRRGQPVATVGSTGNADPSAPHLHFAVNIMQPGESWYGGRPINPYPLLARR